MFKKTFTRTLLFFAAALIIAFSLLGIFTAAQSRAEARAFRRQMMEQTSAATVEAIRSFLTVKDCDLHYLLQNEPELVSGVILSQAKSAEEIIFIANDRGQILLSSESDLQSRSLTEDCMENVFAKAKEQAFFSDDLGGFFDRDYFHHVVLLEKEFTYPDKAGTTKSQLVGAIFFSSESEEMPGFAVPLSVLYLSGAGILSAVAILGMLLFSYKTAAPLQRIFEATEHYAKGDFSVRLPVKGHDEFAALTQALNDMAQSVSDLEKTRASFIANISHDLRTPMTTISGFVQNILEGDIPPEQEDHYLKIVLDETHRLSRLVGELLEMSRLDAGERHFTMAPFDLAELGRITLFSFEKRIEDKKIRVELSVPDHLFANGDSDAIHQVIYNLCDNAIKFTPESGLLRVKVEKGGQKAFFSIYNSGEGIPPEELPHLFERFYKTDRSRGLDKTGTGLGLFIAKSVISAHKEEIWVSSEYGSFCEFVFTLPLADEKNVTKT